MEDGRDRVRGCGRVGSGVGSEGGQRDGVGGWAHITPSPDQSHKNEITVKVSLFPLSFPVNTNSSLAGIYRYTLQRIHTERHNVLRLYFVVIKIHYFIS